MHKRKPKRLKGSRYVLLKKYLMEAKLQRVKELTEKLLNTFKNAANIYQRYSGTNIKDAVEFFTLCCKIDLMRIKFYWLCQMEDFESQYNVFFSIHFWKEIQETYKLSEDEVCIAKILSYVGSISSYFHHQDELREVTQDIQMNFIKDHLGWPTERLSRASEVFSQIHDFYQDIMGESEIQKLNDEIKNLNQKLLNEIIPE